MYLVLSRDMDNVVVHVQFPATLEEVRRDISRLDEHSAVTGPVRIVGASSLAQNLTGYIQRADLDSVTDVKKLSQLAERIDSMGEQEQRIFSGALDAESISGLDDVLRTASSLAQYEFIEGVSSDKELGGWLVEHGLAGVDFPEPVRPYLDYAGIGAEYYASHGGAYTPNGYVKRKENTPEHTVENESRLSLVLCSGHRTCRLNFPVLGAELEIAKQELCVGELSEGMIDSILNGYAYEKGEDGKPKIIPEQAEVVRYIYDSYLAGHSLDMIRKNLETKGVLTVSGGTKWSKAVVRGILQNEKYCGDVLQQKSFVNDCISRKHIRNVGQLPMYLTQDHHEGIVSRDTFNAVKAEFARRNSGRAPSQKQAPTGRSCYSEKYALTGRLVCGECGILYRRCVWSKNGKKKAVWRCTSRIDYGTKY